MPLLSEMSGDTSSARGSIGHSSLSTPLIHSPKVSAVGFSEKHLYGASRKQHGFIEG
jgi:hypothetical protein